MQTIYLDTDVILDYLGKREPYNENALKIFELIENKKVLAYTSSLIIWNLFYLLQKSFGFAKAKNILKQFIAIVKILEVNEKNIKSAIESDINDFEDAVQYYVFKENNLDILLTRNLKDYPKGDDTIQAPSDFLKSVT